MLSRVASSLYWMSRYLERVEHSARVLDVDLVLMLDQAPDYADRRWQRLLHSLAVSLPASAAEPAQLVQTLVFDRDMPQSIIAMLALARNNAREVRNQLSSEMWEQLNQLYLEVGSATIDDFWDGQTHAFFRRIKEGAQLFHGITEATMRQDESWHFVQVGRFLERAEATLTLLNAYFGDASATDAERFGSAYLDQVSLLKSRTAFEAYCQVYTADLQPERIAGFLLLSATFPHSVRFAADRIQVALQAIVEQTNTRKNGPIDRLAGKLRATLDYAQIDEIMDNDLLRFLHDVQRQLKQIHALLHETYFQPPIQALLAS